MHRTQEQYAEKPRIHPLFCFVMLHFLFSVCSKLNSSYFGDDRIPFCRLQSKHLLRIGNKTSWVKCTVQASRKGCRGAVVWVRTNRWLCSDYPVNESLNTITKHEADTYDRPVCLWTSHHKIPGLESYIHISPDTEDKKSLLNGGWWGGFVLWKTWEERGGALWQALCEHRAHILIAAQGGCRCCQRALVYSAGWNTTGLNQTTKCLSHVLFSQSECWASGQWMKADVSDPICQKHVCHYLSNE